MDNFDTFGIFSGCCAFYFMLAYVDNWWRQKYNQNNDTTSALRGKIKEKKNPMDYVL